MSNREVTEGVIAFIERLKASGYKLYVLSNFSVDFQEVIEKNKLDFFKLFDGVFVSAFYKLVKPEREIYETFLKKYGLSAQDCLFIDDNAANVEAAMNLGMKGFHFRGKTAELVKYVEELEK
jgi:HAD superfamily hydrolase (TIGR01509 family)